MNLIAIAIAIAIDVGKSGSAIEIYDRILEDGTTKRVVENGGDDRETEGAP